MSALIKTTPLVIAACLVAGGLACHKPQPAPEPEKPKVVDTSAQDKAKADEDARRRAEAEQKRKAEEAAEAARKAEAAKAAEYKRDAEAALKDVHFDFDKSLIKESEKTILMGIADFLKNYPQANLSIEGNCDERGTVEYNLALGERRASAAMSYLTSLGVSASRLSSISYGKEKPICTESTESCWGKNRRAHFALK